MSKIKYTIKPLAWKREVREWGDAPRTRYSAGTVFGSMYYKANGWGYCFDEYYDENDLPAKSLAEAKKAAKEFYLNKLLEALEASQ